MRLLFLFAIACVLGRAHGDDVLFIGNSFTFAEQAPLVKKNGGVPKLVAGIASAKGKTLSTEAVTSGGKDWAWHLAQPRTAVALAEKAWSWVVLQDFSTRPTRVGDVGGFLRDGEKFSDRIAAASPHAGIVLYETWARPPGPFYGKTVGTVPWNAAEMMKDLHSSYANLRDDLALRNSQREVRVAPVGTAFARATAETGIDMNAPDSHHASAEGYYLAALVIYETIYHESVIGAPTAFYNETWVIPADDAAKLQAIADGVCKS